MAFRKYTRNRFFIEKLSSGGELVQQSRQEEGLRVYEKVPNRMKSALKLDAFEEDVGKARRNGDNETQPLIPNNY